MDRLNVAFLLAALWVSVGCTSNGKGDGNAPPDAATRGPLEPLAIGCTDSKNDVYVLPSGLAPFDATHRGDVFRCSYEGYVGAADANNALAALGYVGPPVAYGMDAYRIAFRTERFAGLTSGGDGGNDVVKEGYSSARVFVPDHRRSEAYAVVAHGTLGQAASCADSIKDIVDPTMTQSAKIMDLALAGNGWAVIEPDYAGFGYDQLPQGWSLAADEAPSILDATRAMKNLLPSSALPPKVFFVGHSQGSHVVLSAQAYARSYGMAGELAGVAPLALLWVSDLTWGASLSPLAGLKTSSDSAALAYGMYYFYGHGGLYDGPGGGLAMFRADKRAQVAAVLDGSCESDADAQLPTLGQAATDFYDPTFLDAVSSCMALGSSCDQEPAATWVQRAIADRPAIDPYSAPIVIWHGALDTSISPARAQCGFDKLNGDLASASAPTTTLTVCGDAQADHGGVVQRDMDWIAQWIDTRVRGLPDPPGCPGTTPLQPASGPLVCATPPVNE